MLKLGEWLFDPPTRRLLRGTTERKLSPKAASVLLALGETAGQVWPRDALLERAWSNVTVGEEVLTHAIAELRRALGDDFRAPRYLETVHKSGYRLLCNAGALAAGGRSMMPRFEGEAPSGAALSFVGLRADDTDDADFDLHAYASYLRACELYERGGRESTLSAVGLYASVVQSNPGFALAHAGLAKALTFLGTYYAPRAGDLDTALEHCALAHRITSGSAEAYAAEGLIFAIGGDFARSVRSFKSAMRLKPESGETHYLLGRACLAELEFDLAAVMLERAAALRPDDYHSLVMGGKVRQKAGAEHQARANYALALPRIDVRLAAQPDDFRALCGKARCLWQLDRADEAVVLMERVAEHPDPMNYHLACTFARAGQAARAMDILEDVIAMGWRHKAWLERDPDFDALRENRRFKRIARSIGAAA